MARVLQSPNTHDQPSSRPPSTNQAPPIYHARQNGSQAARRIRLLVMGLPPQTSTLDIYTNFCHYGSVVRICLVETREGLNSTKAEVDFQPAPSEDFWRRPLTFESPSHHPVQVRCQLSNSQPQNYVKESPVRKGVRYDERMELNGKSLDFGVLSDPVEMMVMGRSGNMQHKPKLVLNLLRKEIEVQFPWQQVSQNRSAVRTFRFLIALDEEFKIWRLSDGVFVFHLKRTPWYSKQLAEAIANTHSPDARVWSIEDTWARQTDLWTYKQRIPEINSSPVALPKHLNDINIFRWTTFRFDPVHDHINTLVANKFVDALRDWNVKILDGASFKVNNAEPGLDKKVWKLINDTHFDKSVSSVTQVSEMCLPFSVRYQLEVCFSNGWLSEYSITPEFLKLLSAWPEARARQALLYVALDQRRLFDPLTIFKDIHYSKPVRAKRLPDNCIEIRSAIITSTGVIFQTPSVEITNRIIRNHQSHAHRFLRVRFEDDQYRGQTRLYPSTNNKMIMIFTRVKRALTNGIKLGNITYDFLAWGNSQLREHGAYFFAAQDGLTADSIRAEMGDFQETVVAKKAARMGQCFSTTRPVHLQLKMINEPDTIPDIVRNGYTFTDGVGKISPDAAALVAGELQIKGPTPCLFQFRLGGCKGVLAVSNDVPGVDVRIRKSQLKFNSLAKELEINRYAQFWQPFLNRQIILCLSSLGVPTEVFIRKQDETIAALNQAMYDDGSAINALRSSIDPNMMTLSLSYLVEAGFRESQEPFVVSFLQLWRAWSLKYLKEKAKIPVEKGAFLLGCVDETATLQGHSSACPSGDRDRIMADPLLLDKLPEIFLQVTDHKTGQRRIIEGICILARNPSLHRGDIRVVRARDAPALHHMCDVVVMPQLGDRDLPSMCSGGDLDGDDYIVIWDEDLIPRFWNAEPFHYDPPTPKTATGEIKTSDLVDFFHDYMQNDALGKIAHAHLAAADFLDNGLESGICLDLVQLHSMAVDYPKTGVPAKMERRLERTQKPHFMEQKFGKPYHSYKVLGRLFDKINKFYEKVPKDAFVKHDLEFDPRILNAFDPDTELTSKVEAIKHEYDISLQRILTQHSIRTEFELWSTFVLEHSKKSRDYKFHEEVGDLSKVLKEEYYEALCELAGGRDFDRLAPVAVAAYRLTRDQLEVAKARAQSPPEDSAVIEMPFISFPWVLQETMIKIASQIKPRRESVGAKSNADADRNAVVDFDASSDSTKDKVYDIAEFHLTRGKLSPYLPDPVLYQIPVLSTREGAEITAGTTAKSQAEVEGEPRLVHLTQGLSSVHGPAISEDLAREDTAATMAVSPAEDLIPEMPVLNVSTEIHKVSESSSTSKNSGSDSPLSENSETQQSVQQDSKAAFILSGPRSKPATSTSPRLRQQVSHGGRQVRQATCFYWKTAGACRYTAQECKYAHYDTGIDMPEKQQITCYFWLNSGTCAFTEATCKFAHHDTGYYSTQPCRRSSIVSSKERNGSGAKRIVTEDSESDYEVERGVTPNSTHYSSRATQMKTWARANAAKIERVNRRKGQQHMLYDELNFATVSNSTQTKDKNAKPHMEATEYLVKNQSNVPGKEPDKGSEVEDLRRQAASTLPVRSHRQSLPAHDLRTSPRVTNGTFSSQRGLATQPMQQLIDFVEEPNVVSSDSPLLTRRETNTNGGFSWLEDLKDLVFDNKESSPLPINRVKVSKAPAAQTMADRNLNSSPLRGASTSNISQRELSGPETPPCKTEATGKHSGHKSDEVLEQLIDNVELDGRVPGSSSVLQSELQALSSPHIVARDNESEPVPINPTAMIPNPADNCYNDPLTHDAADGDEPEIEEIFD